MTPVAVYDANVLYPSALRDFLIRVAVEDLVRARWSDRILDEVFRNIEINRPDLDPARLLHTRQRMCAAVLDCVVKNPPHTALDVVGALERCGLVRFGAAVRTGGLA